MPDPLGSGDTSMYLGMCLPHGSTATHYLSFLPPLPLPFSVNHIKTTHHGRYRLRRDRSAEVSSPIPYRIP
jgi:hypothetical protein